MTRGVSHIFRGCVHHSINVNMIYIYININVSECNHHLTLFQRGSRKGAKGMGYVHENLNHDIRPNLY